MSTLSVLSPPKDEKLAGDVAFDEKTFYYGQDLSNKYVNSKFLAERKVFNNDAAQIALDIPAETTAEVIVTARARTIGNSLESTVENYGNLSEDDGPITETNRRRN